MFITTSSGDFFLNSSAEDPGTPEEKSQKVIESINHNKDEYIEVKWDSKYCDHLINILQNTSTPIKLSIRNINSGQDAAKIIDGLKDTNIIVFGVEFKHDITDANELKEFTNAVSHSNLVSLGIKANLNIDFMTQLNIKNMPIEILYLDGSIYARAPFCHRYRNYYTLSQESFSKLMQDLPESNIHKLCIRGSAFSPEYIGTLDFSTTHITDLEFNKLLHGGMENLNLVGSKVSDLSFMNNSFSTSELNGLCVHLAGCEVETLKISYSPYDSSHLPLSSLTLQETKVTTLALINCQLTDDDLLSLNLKGTNVEVLHLNSNNITDKGMEAFIKQLTDTHVKEVTFGDKDLLLGLEGYHIVDHASRKNSVLQMADILEYDNTSKEIASLKDFNAPNPIASHESPHLSDVLAIYKTPDSHPLEFYQAAADMS